MICSLHFHSQYCTVTTHRCCRKGFVVTQRPVVKVSELHLCMHCHFPRLRLTQECKHVQLKLQRNRIGKESDLRLNLLLVPGLQACRATHQQNLRGVVVCIQNPNKCRLTSGQTLMLSEKAWCSVGIPGHPYGVQ